MRSAWRIVWRLYLPIAYLAAGAACLVFPFDRYLSAVIALSAVASMLYFMPAAMAVAALILVLKQGEK